MRLLAQSSAELSPSEPRELKRTDVVYQYQSNRNPFIDHPELADYIGGDSIAKPWHF
jgi:endonuclease I